MNSDVTFFADRTHVVTGNSVSAMCFGDKTLAIVSDGNQVSIYRVGLSVPKLGSFISQAPVSEIRYLKSLDAFITLESPNLKPPFDVAMYNNYTGRGHVKVTEMPLRAVVCMDVCRFTNRLVLVSGRTVFVYLCNGHELEREVTTILPEFPELQSVSIMGLTIAVTWKSHIRVISLAKASNIDAPLHLHLGVPFGQAIFEGLELHDTSPIEDFVGPIPDMAALSDDGWCTVLLLHRQLSSSDAKSRCTVRLMPDFPVHSSPTEALALGVPDLPEPPSQMFMMDRQGKPMNPGVRLVTATGHALDVFSFSSMELLASTQLDSPITALAAGDTFLFVATNSLVYVYLPPPTYIHNRFAPVFDSPPPFVPLKTHHLFCVQSFAIHIGFLNSWIATVTVIDESKGISLNLVSILGIDDPVTIAHGLQKRLGSVSDVPSSLIIIRDAMALAYSQLAVFDRDTLVFRGDLTKGSARRSRAASDSTVIPRVSESYLIDRVDRASLEFTKRVFITVLRRLFGFFGDQLLSMQCFDEAAAAYALSDREIIDTYQRMMTLLCDIHASDVQTLDEFHQRLARATSAYLYSVLIRPVRIELLQMSSKDCDELLNHFHIYDPYLTSHFVVHSPLRGYDCEREVNQISTVIEKRIINSEPMALEDLCAVFLLSCSLHDASVAADTITGLLNVDTDAFEDFLVSHGYIFIPCLSSVQPDNFVPMILLHEAPMLTINALDRLLKAGTFSFAECLSILQFRSLSKLHEPENRTSRVVETFCVTYWRNATFKAAAIQCLLELYLTELLYRVGGVSPSPEPLTPRADSPDLFLSDFHNTFLPPLADNPPEHIPVPFADTVQILETLLSPHFETRAHLTLIARFIGALLGSVDDVDISLALQHTQMARQILESQTPFGSFDIMALLQAVIGLRLSPDLAAKGTAFLARKLSSKSCASLLLMAVTPSCWKSVLNSFIQYSEPEELLESINLILAELCQKLRISELIKIIPDAINIAVVLPYLERCQYLERVDSTFSRIILDQS